MTSLCILQASSFPFNPLLHPPHKRGAGALCTLIAVAAVLALGAALAGRADKPCSALAGAGAVDAVHADAVAEAGAPGLPGAGLALRPEEASAALPGLQAEKRHAEGQHQGREDPGPSTRGCMHVAAGRRLSGLLLGGGSCRWGFLAVLELCCLWPCSLHCQGSGCHPKSLLGCGCPLPPRGKVEELLGINMVLPFPNSLCIPLLPLLQPSAAFSLLISAVSSPQTNTRPLCTAIRDHLDVLCVCWGSYEEGEVLMGNIGEKPVTGTVYSQ